MKSILVVAGEHPSSEAITAALEKLTFRVARIADGLTALKRVGTTRPNLIVVSPPISGMSGLEFALAVKAQLKYRHVPIILAATARAEPARANRELFAAIFEPPFDPELLARRVVELIGKADESD